MVCGTLHDLLERPHSLLDFATITVDEHDAQTLSVVKIQSEEIKQLKFVNYN